MENYTIILFVLGVMIMLSAVADKIKISPPILLIFTGIGIGFLPGIPQLKIDPDLIFLIFLPPLLYDAAFNISFKGFKNNLGTISSLAIGLVFITTLGIAVIAHYLIPGMTWPVSFVLGSILAATDAVAAMSITKNLGLSPNTAIILEGESLINDASALVAYHFAVASVTGAIFIWWKASFTFLILMAGGLLTGVIMSKVLGVLLRSVRTNTMAVLSFTVLAPFVTYLLAEEFHCSGVIAVVALGLGISLLSAGKFPETLRQQSKTIWSMIVFLLNGFIFILIGLEFPIVVKAIDPKLLLSYTGYAFLITLLIIFLRIGRIFLKRKSLDLAFRNPRLKNSKRAIPESILLSFQDSIIIGWSGMRGIVSLAIAVALPLQMENGIAFPMRDALIFIATVVVLFTIVGQGFLLPFIIKRTRRIESA